jgi:hypothetical protein
VARLTTGNPPDGWIAATRRLRLRLLRAQDAVPLREVVDAGLTSGISVIRGNRPSAGRSGVICKSPASMPMGILKAEDKDFR